MPKPSVNAVSMAFHQLHADVRAAMTHMNGSRHISLNEQVKLIDEAHDRLRTKLQAWGMADLIDWTVED